TSELPRGLRRGRAAADSASSPAASSPAARAASSPARPAADRGAAAVAPGSTEPDQEVIDASDGLRRDSSTRPPTMPICINGAAGPEPDGGVPRKTANEQVLAGGSGQSGTRRGRRGRTR